MLVAGLVSTAAGCTHWTRTEVATTAPRQVGVTMLGEPQLEQIETSEAATDYVEATAGDEFGSVTAGSVDHGRTTIRRTRCTQKALVDFEQDVELRPVVTNRAFDIAGGIGLALLGGIVAGVAHTSYAFDRDNYETDLGFYNMDPSFFPKPTEPTRPSGYYTAGAALGIAGAGLIAFSFAALPHGSRPERQRLRRHWTSERYLDTTGCR